MPYNNDGYKYLKTGDETGDLCKYCGSSMFIDKYGKEWTIRCHCGREIPFISNARDSMYARAAYK